MTTSNTSPIVASTLEIVGINGAASTECGRALPIARRKSDGAHAVMDLSDGGARLNWHQEGEAASLLKQGRWTKFVAPLFVPAGCCDLVRQNVVVQPMVVFADDRLLDTADRLPRPTFFNGEYLSWRCLVSRPATVRATCSSEGVVEQLLDVWSSGLLQRFDAMYRIGRDRDYLRRVADFALCAARDRTLRWKAFIYFATVQESDRVRSTFDTPARRPSPARPCSPRSRQRGLTTASSLRRG